MKATRFVCSVHRWPQPGAASNMRRLQWDLKELRARWQWVGELEISEARVARLRSGCGGRAEGEDYH